MLLVVLDALASSGSGTGVRSVATHLLRFFIASIASVVALVAMGEEPTKKASIAAQVIYLHAGRDFSIRFGATVLSPLLGRELARQALLMAAREEFSCVTRDVHLGQTLPKGGCIELDLLGVAGNKSRLVLMKVAPMAVEAIGMEEFTAREELDLVSLVPLFERFSRNEMVSQLRSMGLTGAPRPWNNETPAPKKVSELLQDMNFVSQWDAACRLHGEVMEKGRSPELVAALSMAYANLGLLTEYHWSTAHNVFTARSLLYAQRLVFSNRSRPKSLLTRAYAYALAGFFPAALADLRDLKTIAKRDVTLPSEQLQMADLLDAYCHFKIDKLVPKDYEPELFELATLLKFLVHDASTSDATRIEFGLKAREQLPHCYRIIASLADQPGIYHEQRVTDVLDTPTVRATLYERIAAIEGISPDVLTMIRKPLPNKGNVPPFGFLTESDSIGRAKLIDMLANAEDSISSQNEMGWPVLASLIAEHSFLEVFQRAEFNGSSREVPTNDFLDDKRPLYEKHPYAPLMETFRIENQRSDAAIAKAKKIDLDTGELQALNLIWIDPNATEQDSPWMKINDVLFRHTDPTFNKLSRQVSLHPEYAYYIELLWNVCPEHPLAQLGRIEHKWGEVQKNLDQWLKRGEKNPDLLVAIGKKFEAENKLIKALEPMKRACEIQPNFENYKSLASVYKKMAKWIEWESTLENSLLCPTSGLEPFQVKEDIARYYFRIRRFEEALRFAEEAAEGFSTDGLLCAAECHEALQNWKEAEAYYRAASERDSETWWFSFTKRTGRGDSDAARDFTTISLENPDKKLYTLDPSFYFALFSGNHEAAIKRIEGNWSKDSKVLFNGFLYALLLDEQKRTDDAISILRQTLYLMDQPNKEQKIVRTPAIRNLMKLIEADLAAGGNANFPPGSIEKARSRFQPGENVSAFDYFAGRYYELHGKENEAWRCYIQCMAFPDSMTQVYRTLSGMRLQKMGEEPTVYFDALHNGEILVQK